MFKIKEIKALIEENIPLLLQEKWDNSGLIIGCEDSVVNKILIALDVTDRVIEEAINLKANLIISHHPVIFDGTKNIDYSTPLGNKIRKLVKNDINVLSYHTNFDKAKGGTTDTICTLLGLSNVKNLNDEEFSFGKIGITNPVTLKEFILVLKEKLKLKNVKYIGNENKIIGTVAVVSGSGSEFYKDAYDNGADVFVTAEVKHHIGIECMEMGLAVIDAGHFETEYSAMETIYELLKDKLEVSVTKEYTELFKYI